MKFPCLIVASAYPLEVVDVEDVENIFTAAEAVWRARGCPQMWMFDAPAHAPWSCDSVKFSSRKKK